MFKSIKKYLPLLLALIVFGSLVAGCRDEKKSEGSADKRTRLVLYSELDNKFTEELVAAFNAKHKELAVQAIYELKQGGTRPDVVLAEKRTLCGLQRQRQLKQFAFAAGDRLPQKFRDKELYWYGVFYDPTVFLINQQYARTLGQERLKSWKDLENTEQLRIAIENLSDSNSTQNYLAAFADHYGEATSLNYLWNINRFIGQYSKFPFTPIRMTAVGDADLAITRQSYVFKYLESKFPAYVVYPAEGTPVNLFCLGEFKECSQEEQAMQLMEWILTAPEVQKISQENATGYLFLFPRGIEGAAADAEKIWLNSTYLEPEQQERLTTKWLDKVRFSK